MRKRTIGATVTLVALAVLAVYAGWAIHAGAGVGLGWRGFATAWPFLLAGALTLAAVIGAFVWLAFFSERRGYDDRAGGADR
jgi:hypothetical protein